METTDRVIGLDSCAARTIDRRRVAAAQRRLITVAEAARLAELFRLLGDPNRMRILFALLEAGELCVCDLAAAVSVVETSVSHALRLLRTAGVVRARRDGRMIYYTLDDAHVRLLLDLSREHIRHGDSERDRPLAATGESRPSRRKTRQSPSHPRLSRRP